MMMTSKRAHGIRMDWLLVSTASSVFFIISRIFQISRNAKGGHCTFRLENFLSSLEH